tara:strand:+ start:610 stop:912 length:303 start_codon:yes stop_codon:yes gene_type:complete
VEVLAHLTYCLTGVPVFKYIDKHNDSKIKSINSIVTCLKVYKAKGLFIDIGEHLFISMNSEIHFLVAYLVLSLVEVKSYYKLCENEFYCMIIVWVWDCDL